MQHLLNAADIDDLVPELIALRRDLHAHPELAFEERRTAGIVAVELRRPDLEVHEGLAGTGIVGTLRQGRSSGRSALRADMDALPITEQQASCMPVGMPVCITVAVTTAIPRYCSVPQGISRARAVSTGPCTSSFSPPKKAAVARA
jgi:hypothetical protein